MNGLFIVISPTKIPWSVFKRGFTIFGMLQNRGVPGEICVDVVLAAVELVFIWVNEKKRYKCAPTEMEEETFSISSNVFDMNH